VDEEAEDRFTELARARLADTLSEAARMLTAPADPGDPAGPGTHAAPSGERAGGRGFDDVLLGRGARATLGLAPAPAEEPPAPSGPTASGPPIRLEPPVPVAAVAEVGELRRQVADLRGRVEHLQSELRTALERLASVPVASRAPATEPVPGPGLASVPVASRAPATEPVPGPPPELSRPVAGGGSPSTPAFAGPTPPAAPARPSPAAAEASPVGSAAGAPPDPPALPADGYTWAFTQTPRRRFWRRR
jgi:hypothetical protein